MIGTRTLMITLPEGEKELVITIHTPEGGGDTWTCRYDVDWPGGTKSLFARGYDALQAAHLAQQNIGAELYTSEYHQRGQLRWGRTGEGYGFPVPKPIRELLVGEDREFEG